LIADLLNVFAKPVVAAKAAVTAPLCQIIDAQKS
jgi:hypothetical protein